MFNFGSGGAAACNNVNAAEIDNNVVSYGTAGIHQQNFYTGNTNQNCESTSTGGTATQSLNLDIIPGLMNLQNVAFPAWTPPSKNNIVQQVPIVYNRLQNLGYMCHANDPACGFTLIQL